MAARRAMLLTLSMLLPCGFLILVAAPVFRASSEDGLLREAIPMKKAAALASAFVVIAALLSGCGSGAQTAQLVGPRSMSLSMRDNSPQNVSVLAFEIMITGANLMHYSLSTVSFGVGVNLSSLAGTFK